MGSGLARFFRFSERGTDLRTEIRAGVTTFLTMAYILVVNPYILSTETAGENGMSFAAAAGATALAAGLTCILMGLISNFPLALASGMGLNAYVAISVMKNADVSWQTAMGLVVLDGVIVLILVLAGVRERVLTIIPADLKRAIGAGIGLFLAAMGLVNARIVVIPAASVAAYSGALSSGGLTPAVPPVGPGPVDVWGVFLAFFGLIVMGVLHARKVRGAILIGILATTALAVARDLLLAIPDAPIRRLALAPPDLSALGQADVLGAATNLKLIPLLLGLTIVDFFDTLGTVTAIGEQADLTKPGGTVESAGPVLAVDASGAVIGGLCGASSVTAYVESAAGVGEGGRTGLMPVVTGILFLASLALAPLLSLVPSEATAPALILVGLWMLAALKGVDWTNTPVALAAFVVLIAMPFTYSISHGIGYGFITYAVISALCGRWREVHPVMYVIAAGFAAAFLFVEGL